MRIFGIVLVVAAFLLGGLTANPAYANCNDKIAAAEKKLSALPKDMPVRQQIKKKLAKAKKFMNNKKKKKKCKKILAKVNKLLKKSGKQAKSEGIGGCDALIKEAESALETVNLNQGAYGSWQSNIVEAKEYNAKSKNRECSQLMKKTIKQIANNAR
jgi:hypothetical protein